MDKPNKPKILIVEDEKIIAMTIAKTLHKSGYQIADMVSSGEEAIAASHKLIPDLVLMDINLSGNMNGIEAAKHIYQIAQIPVVYLTSYADKATIAQAQGTGSFGYLVKPFKEKEIDAAIQIALSKHQEEITTKKALSIAQEQNREQANYIAIAAHELRNPLSNIQLAISFLEDYSDKITPQKRQQKYQSIHNAIEMMNRLIEEALVLGQLNSDKLTCEPESVNLEELGYNIIEESQSKTTKHQIIYEYISQGIYSSHCQLDPYLLRLILTNLLNNAIKYSPHGGLIKLIILCNKKEVIFKISDQGIGIPLEFKNQLFQRFSRASNVGTISGTGLGLNLVKQLVELHQGHITVESELNIGSTFIVTIPLTSN